jgi:adenylate cyclase class 2
VATLDETPVGVYFELEGQPNWIDRTARRMGFAESAYIMASYHGLYIDYCRDRGVPPTNMTFEATPSSSRRAPSSESR